MCGFARNATVTQLSTVVRRYGFEPDPGDPPPDAEPDNDVTSEVSLWVDDAGTGHVKATLEPDRFRVFETAMREARDALFHTGHPNVTWTDATGRDRRTVARHRHRAVAARPVPGQHVHPRHRPTGRRRLLTTGVSPTPCATCSCAMGT
ncbi:MAG: hypothetical protein WKF58_15380 [Ilumatobacteraceae bacterium]